MGSMQALITMGYLLGINHHLWYSKQNTIFHSLHALCKVLVMVSIRKGNGVTCFSRMKREIGSTEQAG